MQQYCLRYKQSSLVQGQISLELISANNTPHSSVNHAHIIPLTFNSFLSDQNQTKIDNNLAIIIHY